MAVVQQLSCQLHRNFPEEEEKEEEEVPPRILPLEVPLQRVAASQWLRARLETAQWSQSSTRTRRRGFSVCSEWLRFSSSSSSMRPPPPKRRTPSATTTRGDTSTLERLSGCQCLTIPCTSAKPRVSSAVTSPSAGLSSCLSRQSRREDARLFPRRLQTAAAAWGKAPLRCTIGQTLGSVCILWLFKNNNIFSCFNAHVVVVIIHKLSLGLLDTSYLHILWIGLFWLSAPFLSVERSFDSIRLCNITSNFAAKPLKVLGRAGP